MRKRRGGGREGGRKEGWEGGREEGSEAASHCLNKNYSSVLENSGRRS